MVMNYLIRGSKDKETKMKLSYINLNLQSHHRAREGAFELNDVFAIINAVPAIALLNFGFFHKGLVPGLCFGAVCVSLNLWFSLATLAVKGYP
jgi:hypothetical protein